MSNLLVRDFLICDGTIMDWIFGLANKTPSLPEPDCVKKFEQKQNKTKNYSKEKIKNQMRNL